MTAPAPGAPAPLLMARGLRHRFGATQALAGVSLEVREREILGLAGPGGSGKSTLVETLSGRFPYDEGETVFRGFPIRLRSRHDGVRIGVALVEQRPRLVPDLSVYENIVLPLLGRSAKAEPPDLRRRVGTLLEGLGQGEAPALRTRAARLTAVQVRLVALARALTARAKLYLFDEPFATLASRDADALAGIMGKLRLAGCGLIVAARRLDDLLPLADRVTVLDAGVSVLTASARTDAGQATLRRALPAWRPATASAATSGAGGRRLVVAGLTASGVDEASLTVAAGEIVAVHGGRDAGCEALAETVAGLRPRQGGTVSLGMTELPAGNPKAALRAGLAFCGPQPRPLLPERSGWANLALVDPGPARRWSPQELGAALGLSDDALAAPTGRQPAGIRQRIALAGTLLAGHAAVALHDPVRGLDTGERDITWAALRAAAHRGAALLVACSDPGEAAAVADRVLVMREGRLAGELAPPLLEADLVAALAMPSAAAARGAALLAELTRENGGAAFWVLLGTDHAVCLGCAVAERSADPGLHVARASRLEDTGIREALTRRDPALFVAEPDAGRATLLTPLASRRGRATGWIGLTLPTGPARLPPPAAVAFRVETLAAAL